MVSPHWNKLLLVLLALSIQLVRAQPGLVSKGKLNLSGWNPHKHPVISLDGEWLFFYNELLQEQEIKSRSQSAVASFSIPWNEQLIAGSMLSGRGCATYYAEVYLQGIKDSMALEVPAVYNSYALWVNGSLTSTNGKVAAHEEDMEPFWRPTTVPLTASGDTLRIVFQVANFQLKRGGSIIPMRLGLHQSLFGIRRFQKMSTEFIVISLFTIIVFCLLTFLISKRKTALYFSLFAVFFCVRSLFSDLYLYQDYLGTIPWQLAVRIEYATMPVIAMTSVLFVSAIYPLDIRKSAKTFLLISNLLLLISIAVAPVSAFSQLLVIFQIMGITVALYCTYVIARAAVHERMGAWLSAVGTFMFALVFIYNILIYMSIFEFNPLITNIGYITAFIFNTAALVYRDDVTIREEGVLRYSDLYEDANP
jgi:hypothetical protein